jgi:hypothetical protein
MEGLAVENESVHQAVMHPMKNLSETNFDGQKYRKGETFKSWSGSK